MVILANETIRERITGKLGRQDGARGLDSKMDSNRSRSMKRKASETSGPPETSRAQTAPKSYFRRDLNVKEVL